MKFESPLEAFLHWEKNTPDKIFLRQPISGIMHEYSFKKVANEVRKLSTYLSSLNLPEKSHIALLSKNCAHWIMADLAIMMAGHISIPIYPTLNADSISHILTHSESKLVFIGKLDDFESQKAGIPDIPAISVEAYGEEVGTSWEEILKSYEPQSEVPQQQKDELISIIYTSGTTGLPKGVMHTTAAFTEVINTAIDLLKIEQHSRLFSYLPLSHIAERIITEMGAIFAGGTMTFPESLATFAADLEAAKPHLFFGVPRIYAKFQEAILAKMPQSKLDRLTGIPILGSIVKKKIAKKLGLSDAKVIFSGAAPISVSMINWYGKLGITILQGYGMTEDCILSHYNLPEANKIGSVGKLAPGVTSKLTPEDEICIKSNCLTKGYYKEPEMTAEIFDEEGYLKTGDMGEYDHDGFLTITGRVKDMFKTDKGKYIAPAPIELDFMKNPDVELICIVGTGIPQPIALIVPSEAGKQKSREELSESLKLTINTLNPGLEKVEKLAKAVVMKEEWTVDNGLMTPTFKTRRNQIEKIHMPMYGDWFHDERDVIYEE